MIRPIYKSKNIQVFFKTEVPCIVWRPLGEMTQSEWEESFRAGLNEYLLLMADMPNVSWLNDTTHLEYIDAKQISWLRGFANERLKAKSGYYNVAFVKPVSSFGAISVNFYIKESLADPKNNLIFAVADSLQSAENWLIKNQRTPTGPIREMIYTL